MAGSTLNGWIRFWDLWFLFRDGLPFGCVSTVATRTLPGLYAGFVYGEPEEGSDSAPRQDFATESVIATMQVVQRAALWPMLDKRSEELVLNAVSVLTLLPVYFGKTEEEVEAEAQEHV